MVGTDVFHAAILLWAAGLAHWVGGNVDLGLAANILVGSIPGVLIGSQLAVKIPTGFLRNALGVVMIASAIVLLVKEKVPTAVLIPSLSVAALVVVALFTFQIGLHRQRMRQDEAKSARSGSQSGRLTPAPGGGPDGYAAHVDFDLSPRVSDLRDRVRAFMAEHVLPVELEALRALDDEVRPGTPYPQIIVDIRAKAREAGLWNLFMPDERYGAGLTNWEYGIICEETGRSPAIAPMAFNCSAPDTGNMEILAEHGTEEQTCPMARSAPRGRHSLLLLDDRARGRRL